MTQLEATPYQPPTPPSRAKIYAALAKAQAMMTGAKKDAANSHFRSKYATLEAVIEAVRPALSANGISFYQDVETDGAKVTCYTTLGHESGEEIVSRPMSAEAKGKGPQEIGSTETYLRRYQLMALCGIAPEDDDGEAAHGRQGEQTQASRTQAQQAAKQQTTKTQAAAQGPTNPPNGVIKPDEAAELRKRLTEMIKREGHDAEAIKAWCVNRGYPDSSAKLNAEQLTELIEFLTQKESA